MPCGMVRGTSVMSMTYCTYSWCLSPYPMSGVCAHTHTHVRAHAHTTHKRANTYTHTHTHTNKGRAHTRTHTHNGHTHTHTQTHARTHAYTHTHTHAHAHAHAYAHAHAHILTHVKQRSLVFQSKRQLTSVVRSTRDRTLSRSQRVKPCRSFSVAIRTL